MLLELISTVNIKLIIFPDVSRLRYIYKKPVHLTVSV